MKFNSNIFCRKPKCFRLSWLPNHYLTYDGENFIEHNNNISKIWYWSNSTQFQQAIIDLNADDWRYIENENT